MQFGGDAIIDAVNDVEPARGQWTSVAAGLEQRLVFVEVFCGDEGEHQRRLAGRRRGIAGFPEPTWEFVVQPREGFRGWVDGRVRVDSMRPLDEVVASVLEYVERVRRAGVDGQQSEGPVGSLT